MTVTSNKVTVTVAGISYTYSISLSASQTSLPSTGGSITLTSVISTNPSGGEISGLTVTFTDQTTGTNGTATTDSTGTATSTATISPNTTLYTKTYVFIASFNNPYTNTTVSSSSVTVTVAAATASLNLSVSPTSLPESGGTITLTATLSGLPSLSGYTVVFVDVATHTNIGMIPTNSSGVATMTYEIPANTSGSNETITFFAYTPPV